jgi:hypothetical protein
MSTNFTSLVVCCPPLHDLFTWYRDILYYLQQKSRPRLQVLHSLSELLPIIHQFERGELQSIGYFSIVVGLFAPPTEGGSAGQVRKPSCSASCTI